MRPGQRGKGKGGGWGEVGDMIPIGCDGQPIKLLQEGRCQPQYRNVFEDFRWRFDRRMPEYRITSLDRRHF